jgi:CubicO group peptidase (beta-lactamase class C family)
MTKVFTALQYFDLMEKTGYNLETHPGNFLKELSRFDGLTVADLMSHRHGLVTTQPYDVNQKYTTQELNTIFHSSDSLQQSQPNQYIYRDTGYYYLGKILELIEGKPLAQINKEFLEKNAIQGITYQPTQNGIPEENIAKSDEFKPIGIPHDNTVSDWFGGVSGFAGLYATQAGLQSFTQKLLENDFQIEPELYKKLFEIQHPANSKNQQSYSLGGWRKGFMSDKYLNISGFTGPGIILDVENKRGIVMTTNITFPKRDEVRTNIYRQWVRSIVKDS